MFCKTIFERYVPSNLASGLRAARLALLENLALEQHQCLHPPDEFSSQDKCFANVSSLVTTKIFFHFCILYLSCSSIFSRILARRNSSFRTSRACLVLASMMRSWEASLSMSRWRFSSSFFFSISTIFLPYRAFEISAVTCLSNSICSCLFACV